ncbi:MAG: hypothetical protein ACOCZ8_02995 [Bacteroidota bacterium]
MLLYDIDPLSAALVALAVTLLHPQWIRLGGHFALAYLHVFPLTWLLLELWTRTHRAKWMLLLTLHTFFISGIHLYFYLMMAAMAALFLALHLLVNREQNGGHNQIRTILWGGVSVILPIAITYTWLSLTDGEQFREEAPFGHGFDQFSSNLNTMLFPLPWKLFFDPKWLQYPDNFRWEGLAYLGLVPTLVAIVLCLRYARQAIQLRGRLLQLQEMDRRMLIVLLTALAMGFLANALPFEWFSDELTEKLGVIRQFRSMGRFAWPYYTLLATLAWIFVYHYLFKRNAIVLKVMTVAMLSFFLAEGHWFQSAINNAKRENLFHPDSEWRQMARELDVAPEDYSALMTVPVVMHGSGRGSYLPQFPDQGLVTTKLYALQMETGLPSLTFESTRVPVDAFIEKSRLFTQPIGGDLPDFFEQHPVRKPLLLLRVPNAPTYGPHAWLHTAGTHLACNETYELRQLTQQAWQAAGERYARHLNEIADSLRSNAYQNGQFHSKDSALLNLPMHYTSFEHSADNRTRQTKHLGQQAAKGVDENLLLHRLEGFQLRQTRSYQMRLWVHLDMTAYSRRYHAVHVVLGKHDGAEQRISYYLNQHSVVQYDDDWALVNGVFEVGPDVKSLEVYLDAELNTIVADDLLIMPEGVHHLWRYSDETLLLDNRFVPAISRDEQSN